MPIDPASKHIPAAGPETWRPPAHEIIPGGATNQTIQHMAREFAGAFYENQRTDLFRKVFPTPASYIAKHWPHFVYAARRVLIGMLADKNVHENLKREIFDALQDERVHQLRGRAKRLAQRSPGDESEKQNRIHV